MRMRSRDRVTRKRVPAERAWHKLGTGYQETGYRREYGLGYDGGTARVRRRRRDGEEQPSADNVKQLDDLAKMVNQAPRS
jgi:hypothetical protein